MPIGIGLDLRRLLLGLVQSVRGTLLGQLLLMLTSLCSRKALSDPGFALVHRPGQRRPNEFHGEPNEHRERHQLGDKRQVDIHPETS